MLWAALLVAVPVTSFPWVARFTRGSTVSPLSLVPLALMIVFWLFPHFLRGGGIPILALPLLLFCLIALLASLFSPLLGFLPFLGQDVIARTARAIITLAIGVCFYLVAARFPNSERALRWSLLFLSIGAIGMLIWSSYQGYLVLQDLDRLPFKVRVFHRLLSIRDLFTSRVTGLAYEPSWLANQLVVLYIPLWVASVVTGFSVLPVWRRLISVELILLLWGLVVLLFSLSRIGILSAFSIFGSLGVFATWNLSGGFVRRIRGRKPVSTLAGFRAAMSTLRVAVLILFMLSLVLLLTGTLFIAAQFDSRIARIFEVDYLRLFGDPEGSIFEFANQLAYAERLIYWSAGFAIFSEHPILGVGLGNSGFDFRQQVPSFGYLLPEIIRILDGSAQFPNPKSLWIRLLAETGILGFLAFTTWLVLLGSTAYRLYNRGTKPYSMIGLAGILALVAQILEGFSLDTFALPQLWIMLGMLTAAHALASRPGKVPGRSK